MDLCLKSCYKTEKSESSKCRNITENSDGPNVQDDFSIYGITLYLEFLLNSDFYTVQYLFESFS